MPTVTERKTALHYSIMRQYAVYAWAGEANLHPRIQLRKDGGPADASGCELHVSRSGKTHESFEPDFILALAYTNEMARRTTPSTRNDTIRNTGSSLIIPIIIR
jgi:hypothetical protein